MIFLDNKYTKTYFRLITAAKLKTYSESYTLETHHIIPRSLGGNDDIDNLVTFSAREHYVSHLLLTKMVTGESRSKMCWALHRMTFSDPTKQKKIRFTSSEYEMARKIFIAAISGPKEFRTEIWKDAVRERVTKDWAGNDARRKQLSIDSKLRWENNRERYSEIARNNGNHSLHGRPVYNALSIEYNGVTYLGWDALYQATKISKKLYRKYYLNGIDPTPRIGTDGGIKGKPWSEKRRKAYENKKRSV